MRTLFALFLVLAICQGSFAQGVVGWINQENQIVLEPLAGRAVSLSGVDLQSPAGLLTAGTSTQPFPLQLANSPQQVTYGSLFSIPIQGNTTLDVQYDLSSALEMGIDPCEEMRLGGVGRGPLRCAIPGDADFSGAVEFADFLILSENFGQTGTDWSSGDFDWDRKTEFTDFLQLSKYFGTNYYDFIAQPDELVDVRTSTSEELEYAAGNFVPTPLSVTAPHGDYFVEKGFLWSHLSEVDSVLEPIADNAPITIVDSEIDFSRATHFGAELRRIGEDFELVSVRLMGGLQTLEFRIPDDLKNSLVLPIGTLDSGQYDIEVTRYELTNDGGISEFDVAGFLADPMNFELPDGPIVSSVSNSTLTFQVGATGAASVPEPEFELLSLLTLLFAGLAIRRSR